MRFDEEGCQRIATVNYHSSIVRINTSTIYTVLVIAEISNEKKNGAE